VKVKAVTAIGAGRPPCEQEIRVAEGLKTRCAQHGAWRREQAGLPINQCGSRSDFIVDGSPRCRAHAGQMALNYLIRKGARA